MKFLVIVFALTFVKVDSFSIIGLPWYSAKVKEVKNLYTQTIADNFRVLTDQEYLINQVVEVAQESINQNYNKLFEGLTGDECAPNIDLFGNELDICKESEKLTAAKQYLASFNSTNKIDYEVQVCLLKHPILILLYGKCVEGVIKNVNQELVTVIQNFNNLIGDVNQESMNCVEENLGRWDLELEQYQRAKDQCLANLKK